MFEETKYKVAIANRVLTEVGLASGVLVSLGHISQRVPEDPNRFIVKGRGYQLDALPRMLPSDMIVCDLDGYFVEGPPGSTQCFEVKMHSCIYRTHPEVHSVVHVHPRFAVMMSVLQARLVPMCNEGSQLVRKPLPVYRHNKIVQTDEEGMEVASLLGDGNAVILHGHGTCTTGASMAQSFSNTYNLEEQARMNWYAYCAAGPDHPGIPEEMLAERGVNRDQQPHFKDRAAEVAAAQAQRGDAAAGGGVWNYYYDLVERQMKQEG